MVPAPSRPQAPPVVPSRPPLARHRRGPGRRLLRGLALGAVVLVLLVAAGLLAIGPLVRSRATQEAERRGLVLAIDTVRPGFFRVALEGVRVHPRDVAGLDATLGHVEVRLGANLRPTDVHVRGGTLTIEGEPDEVRARLETLRGAKEPGGPTSGERSALALAADDLELRWKTGSGTLVGTGLAAERTADGHLRAGCGRCSVRHGDLALEVQGGRLELGPAGALERVSAEAAAIVLPPAIAAAPAPKATAPEIVPPPLPSITRRKGAKGPPASAPARRELTPEPTGPVLPLPELHALRARIATAVAAFGPRVPDGVAVEIAGLSARREGAEPLAIGPGTFSLHRAAERLRLRFETAPGAQGTPLSVDADLPLGAGDMTAHLAGGPVSLATLGVQEGMRGLQDVGQGTISGRGQIVLAAAADALTFDGEVTLRSLSIKEPRLSTEPLRRIDLTVSGHGVLDDHGRLRVDGAELAMGALHVKTHGTVEETSDHFAVALALDVPAAACQSLLESAPQGLLPTVRAARMNGVFGASVNLAFDTRTIDKVSLDYRIDDQCRMTEVPRELARERFEHAFTYRTYHPDGTTEETTTGPGTAAFTPLDDISPFMVDAVLTTEDGAFYRHHGFNHAAIRSSVAANLKARRFVRGASTISMQLAKNLFLARDKALSRKIEEVILTDYLEQVLRKDDMMELYLNVVEFGPDVYGITRAADYYFGRKPDELNLVECFFLASLLPSPIRYGKLRDRGEALDGWTRHLHALMEIAAKNGKITRAELEEGLRDSLVFVRAGEPRPERRKPVTSTRADPYEDDAAWRPLD